MEEDLKLQQEMNNKIHNLDHENMNINIHSTLDVKPRSILIPPVKPDLKARMPSIFSNQGSVSHLASEKTGAKLNKD